MIRPMGLMTAVLIANALFAADPEEKIPAEIKALLEKDIELCNAGEWAADAKLHRLPILVFDELVEDESAFIDVVRESNEGRNCWDLSCDLLNTETTKPKLSETARGFLTKNDQLIRTQFESTTDGETITQSFIVIVRRDTERVYIVGYLADITNDDQK